MKKLNIKRIRRAYLMPILTSIKNILNVFKKYALPDYNNPPSIYQMFVEEEAEKCFQHFKKKFKSSLFLKTNQLRVHAIKKAIENDEGINQTYIEFGVFSGTSINQFSKFLQNKTIYGFDSFEGLKEDWMGTSVVKGTFDLKKKIPKLNKNVSPVLGWIENTLPIFLSEKKPSIVFAHIDVDTYQTSKFILQNIKPYLIKNSVLLFDELYNFPGWDEGEYKALKETFNENEYQFISFALNGQQAAIQIL
jgi:hypothetical protein